MTLRLYLVRHGETAWTLSGQHTGRTDIPLTAHGEAEVRALIPRLRLINFSAVLTSPLQRAQRTCELAGLGPIAEVEPDLEEWDYGDYEGQRSVDICKDDRAGTSFGTAALTVKRPGKYPPARTGSSRTCARWMETLPFSRMAK